MPKFFIYSDGGARGNPGPAGIGVIIYDENKNKIAQISPVKKDEKLSTAADIVSLVSASLQAVEIAFARVNETIRQGGAVQETNEYTNLRRKLSLVRFDTNKALDEANSIHEYAQRAVNWINVNQERNG